MMIDIGRCLGELAERVEIPGGDWLVDDVLRRIGDTAPHRPARRAPRLAAACAATVIVAATLVALPGPRHAVARWLGFDSVRIEPTVPVRSTPAPKVAGQSTTSSSSTTIEPTITPAAPELGLGPAIALASAMTQTGLPDPTPALLGAPLSVHVVQPPASGQIVLVYAPSDLVPQSPVTGAGALVSVMPAHIQEGFFGKTLGDTSTVRQVDVDGAVGYWIEGAPHELLFEFSGGIQQDTLRLATNTLLWQRGDHVYRLEADISVDIALQIARSVA